MSVFTGSAGGEQIRTASSFEDVTFEKVDLTEVALSGKEFSRCTFRSAKLNQTKWLGSVLEDCVFESCDLSNIDLKGATLRGVELRETKLVGVVWTNLASYPMVGFADCNLRYQSFTAIDLRNTKFTRCAIDDGTFFDVNLTKASFRTCTLAQTKFERCTLSGADFSTSTGVYFDVAKNKAKGARVSLETAALIATTMGLKVAGFDG